MLSSAAHSKAALVAEHLPGVMPRVYAQTVVNAALIRTVDLGPFKHKIDDGLELRKAAFECMDVLLDACAERLDMPAFIAHLESGLKVPATPLFSAPCRGLAVMKESMISYICPSRLQGWSDEASSTSGALNKIDDRRAGGLLQRSPLVHDGDWLAHAQDHYDVKLSCHLLLAKLAAAAPAQLLAALERLGEPLEKTLTFRLKSESVKQEARVYVWPLPWCCTSYA